MNGEQSEPMKCVWLLATTLQLLVSWLILVNLGSRGISHQQCGLGS